MPGVDARLGLVARVVADRPGIARGVGEQGPAGGHEELRDLVVVEILPDRKVGRGPERLEQKRDLLVLDEPADLFDGPRRAIAVVEAEKRDLPTVHAALIVDLLEVGGLRAADHAIGGSGTAVGHRLPDLDLGAGDARRIGPGRAGCGRESRGGGARLQEPASREHGVAPFSPRAALRRVRILVCQILPLRRMGL